MAMTLGDVVAIFGIRSLNRMSWSVEGIVAERQPCLLLLWVVVLEGPKHRE